MCCSRYFSFSLRDDLGPVMVGKPPTEEKHVGNQEPKQITTNYAALLVSLQYALGQALPSQPNQPASTAAKATCHRCDVTGLQGGVIKVQWILYPKSVTTTSISLCLRKIFSDFLYVCSVQDSFFGCIRRLGRSARIPVQMDGIRPHPTFQNVDLA